MELEDKIKDGEQRKLAPESPILFLFSLPLLLLSVHSNENKPAQLLLQPKNLFRAIWSRLNEQE